MNLFLLLLLAALLSFSTAWATPKERGDSFLLLLVEAPGLRYSSFQALIDSLSRRPASSAAFGHCWIAMEGWVGSQRLALSCGHSGERLCANQPRYVDGVMELMERGFVGPSTPSAGDEPYEPNPIRYLWESRSDGFLQRGAGGHQPTFVALRKLDDPTFLHLLRWLFEERSYGYERYSLLDHQCVHFVVDLLRQAGLSIEVDPQQIPIPSQLHWKGSSYRLWADPRYSCLSLLTPEQLVKALRKAREQGELFDGTGLYRRFIAAHPTFRD